MKKFNCRKAVLALSMSAAVGLAACGDDPVSSHDEEGHGDGVEGVQLWLSGSKIASYDGDTKVWTGELEVEEGEETAHIDVRFVNHDGVKVQLGSSFYLEVVVSNEAIAEFEQDTPGEFGGHLHGVSEGETDVVFKLMHGTVGSGHPDLITTAVHAHVGEHDH